MRYYNVEVDLMSDDIDTSNIWYAQRDIGGRLHISLLSNNEPIDLEGRNVYIFFERKDGITFQESFTVTDFSEGKGFVDIASGILDIPGKINVTIKLYERDILRLSFVSFPIMCKKSINSDEAIVGTNQIDVIQSIFANSDKINLLEDSVENKIEALSTEVTQKLNELSSRLSERLEEQATEVSKAISTLENSLQNDLVEQDNKLTQVTSEIMEEVATSMLQINVSMSDLREELSHKSEELATTLENNIMELRDSVNQSLSMLDSRKIDYIVSENEPDVEEIPLGTIWIKPNISVGD